VDWAELSTTEIAFYLNLNVYYKSGIFWTGSRIHGKKKITSRQLFVQMIFL